MLHSVVLLAALTQSIIGQSAYVRTIAREDKVEVIQTLTRTLSAPGLPDVVLVGAAHIGLKSYYQKIQERLNAQSVVLFEGVRRDGAASDIPVAAPGGKKPIYQVLGDAVGLDFQLADIDYSQPNWINSDLSMKELDRLNKVAGKGKPTSFDTVKKLLNPESDEMKMAATYISAAPPAMKEAIKIFLVESLSKSDVLMASQLDPATLTVILDERNKSVI